ncbi:MAG TPA: monofunctional biosynthetic peptidoglycan transglycosylase [Hyphomicrobiaceae bacterium]|nr:monofunctional biosynthetic peptidoglycan transglycosylase [Hyphomicrobiaceae bacterium]
MTTDQTPDGLRPDAITTVRTTTANATVETTLLNQVPPETTSAAPTAPPPVTASTPDTRPAPRSGRSHWYWPRFLFRVGMIGILLVILLVASLVVAYRWIDPPSSTLMFGQRLMGTEIRQEWRPLDRISPNLIAAVVTSEDSGFCRHNGVDWIELEAAYERGQDGGIGGGSTISMQLIKNLFLWPSRSYIRKALEIPLTLASESVWPKRRILEMYLNIVELGPGIFGAEAASRHYFGKSAANLTAREAALLASALPNPLQRDSSRPSQLHRTLATRLESRMKAAGRFTSCILP